MSQIVVCAMYEFITLEDFEAMCQPLLDTMIKNNVKGTLTLANEGINGTVAGTRKSIDGHTSLFKKIRSTPNRFDYKESYNQEMPFYCSKVKLKKDIVTLGINEIDPNKVCGKYVEPKDWNALISEPGTVLIDIRNEYEIEIGTFKNAINPHPENFLNMSMRNSTLKSIKK